MLLQPFPLGVPQPATCKGDAVLILGFVLLFLPLSQVLGCLLLTKASAMLLYADWCKHYAAD